MATTGKTRDSSTDLDVYVGTKLTRLQVNAYGNFDAPASTLGLAPGTWPGHLAETYTASGRVWLHKGSNGGEGKRSGAVAYVARDGLVRLLVWAS